MLLKIMRRAGPDDLPKLIRFQQSMAAETESLTLDPQTVAAGIQRVMHEPDLGTYWVLEEEGEVVGCLMTLYEWSDWRAQRVVWIHSVYIRPISRRKGLFRAAYHQLQHLVQESPDLAGLRLYVARENEAAQRVYADLGMDGEHHQLYEWLKPRR